MLLLLSRREVHHQTSSLKSILCRPWFQLYMVFMAALSVSVIDLFFRESSISSDQKVSGKSYRFTALANDVPQAAQPSVPGIASFGLLWDGCRSTDYFSSPGSPKQGAKFDLQDGNLIVGQATPMPALPRSTLEAQGAQMTLTFDAPVEMNGWFFEGIPEEDGKRPKDFVIEVQENDGDP